MQAICPRGTADFSPLELLAIIPAAGRDACTTIDCVLICLDPPRRSGQHPPIPMKTKIEWRVIVVISVLAALGQWAEAATPVQELKAAARDGQVFLTWKES